jgi:serine protease AprX
MSMMRRTPIAATVICCALAIQGAGAQHHAHLSDALLHLQTVQTALRSHVIVHGDLDAIATAHHLQIVRRLATGGVVLANSAELADLAGDSALDHLSDDPPVAPTMSVSNQATAADQARAGAPGLLGIGAYPPVTGQGVGVAVVDSGITPHAALANRIVANVSFVSGDPSTLDAYGHGTHVAGIIAGLGSAARSVTPLFDGGIAPGAQLVNVRVLGADGSGQTSDVIAGIEWVIANRSKYNIKVINLSIGHPVGEPAATDPLCEVVAQAVQAGLTVVAAAGNSGLAADGSMVLGSIVSPGNSPWAITVGALNTWGTASRSDDTVATYSSRGPTKYDMTVKPDVAAPGNKIISLEAQNSYLSLTYPYLHKAGSGSNAYMQLSGTSMAAPMVSGGVALLLQGTPNLLPAQVKLALQMGATYVPNGGLLGAGAGSVNFWASRKIVGGGLVSQLLTTVGGLVTPASGVAFWDAGTLQNNLYGGTGIRLLSLVQALLAWLNPTLLHYGDLNLLGLNNPLASVAPKWLLYGQVAGWTGSQAILWGDNIYDPQGQAILWGDNTQMDGTAILWGDSMTAQDPW